MKNELNYMNLSQHQEQMESAAQGIFDGTRTGVNSHGLNCVVLPPAVSLWGAE